MDVTEIISRLSGVRKTGPDAYVAKCPAHADKSPSLTVKGLSDGRILLHCFAGCDTESVLGAVGLTFSDLFPEKLGEFRRARPAFTAADALHALSRESSIVAIAASDICEGKPLKPDDAERVCVAAGRIADALAFVHGGGR